METEELWGKGWSLRTEQDPRTMTYLGTITKSGIHFHYYRDDDGEIYLDRKSTRLNSSHVKRSRMPSSA